MSAKKATASAKKSVSKKSTAKTSARRKVAKVKHRGGDTIRASLEVIYKKHGKAGYAEAKAEAIKKGFNKLTVQKQMWLIHNGL